jgi:hypothetical protein
MLNWYMVVRRQKLEMQPFFKSQYPSFLVYLLGKVRCMKIPIDILHAIK